MTEIDGGTVSLLESFPVEQQGPVECLGMTFENDEERRDYFLERLRRKLEDPEFRKIEGFPVGEDKDILALSDPPYYTACPNPFVEEFVRRYGTPYASASEYSRVPYCGTLRASKRHPVYSFHPYHTKVPPDVIRLLIEHYTMPGDLVFDGFGGTGMTGVAARDSNRHAIIGDLSPIATFISSVNNRSHDYHTAVETLKESIRESKKQWGFLYQTEEYGIKIPTNYYVWSDVFTCPECVFEFPFFPHGVIHHGNKVETRKRFPCPSCHAELSIRKLDRVIVYEGKKKQLVWVNAGTGKNRINREPTEYDLALNNRISSINIRDWYPTGKIDPEGYSARLAQLGDKSIADVSHFLSKRNLIVLSDLWTRTTAIDDIALRNLCRATMTSIFTVISERQGYFGGGGGMSGNLYMPVVRMEKNIFDVLSRKLKKMESAEIAKLEPESNAIVTTQSLTNICELPDDMIDYIYTDPPFGANIIYSEMNTILESWLKVRTNDLDEAVIDDSRNRKFDDYAFLMRASFNECYRILKPGRWMTVEFHNTQASIWNLIQTAMGESGFVIAQVDVFDKGSTTILADIRPGAARQDLIISAYKPYGEDERGFELKSGTEEGLWGFIRTHLKQIPVFLAKNDQAEVIVERQDYLLFDRMVAFHVQRGATVPLSATEFYAGLEQRFPFRDGMYFLPEQVEEYDRKRMTVREVRQLQLFVSDEASAIQWLKQQFAKKPQTFQDIHPQFLQEIRGWQKHERLPELSELLEENFLRYDGNGKVPSQIHSYLSSNFKEFRNLSKDDSALRAKSKDRWYVPNPNRAGDLEKLRERALMREFQEYKTAKQKRLKVFRLEAVRVGFKKAWQEHDYKTIITVARKIPETVLHEDPKLLMWYDQATTRTGDN